MIETLFFDWQTARMAGADGHLVRRKEWPTWKWLHWYNGLWWLKMASYDGGHVVKADEFGRDEFLAQDWTNLPASCITTIQQKTGTGCPNPYNPTTQINGGGGGGGWINGGGGGGGGSGGSGGGGGNSGGVLTEGNPGTPPSGGGGGGGGGGKGTSTTPKPPRSGVAWPTITLNLTDTSPECYERDPSSPLRNASYIAEVTMSATVDTAAGKPAAGVYMVSVRFGGKSVGVGTITPGGTKTWELNNVAKGNPGLSTFTFEARASLPGKNSGDIIATKSATMHDWCPAYVDVDLTLWFPVRPVSSRGEWWGAQNVGQWPWDAVVTPNGAGADDELYVMGSLRSGDGWSISLPANTPLMVDVHDTVGVNIGGSGSLRVTRAE